MNTDWMEFRQRAEERLRRGTESNYFGLTRAAQLLVFPAFDNVTCWDLVRVEPGNPFSTKFRIRCGVWFAVQDGPDVERDDDYAARFRAALPSEPTIRWTESEVDSPWLYGHLRTLGSLELPAAPPTAADELDGVHSELTLGNAIQGSTFRWCEQAPYGWHRLAELCDELVKYLRGLHLAVS